MMYFLPEDPASPAVSISQLRGRARRAGYRIQSDHGGVGTYSLIDAKLGLPILDHVAFGEIAKAVETARAATL